jgi:23S rRNA (pseudouridine1915-N3)-methyltransferase
MVRESDMEGERDGLLKLVKPSDVVVALDERGKEPTTIELAAMCRQWMESAQPVVLVLGGADGLHPDVKARAQTAMALSRLTLPHRMAQMLLLEQLYRAHTILRGEKYHRA